MQRRNGNHLIEILQNSVFFVSLMEISSTCPMPNSVSISNSSIGKCYSVFDNIHCATYDTAKSNCEAVSNSRLVHLETESEQSWLYNQLLGNGLPTGYWLGLEKIDGTWKWAFGEENILTAYDRFITYQPTGPEYAISHDSSHWLQMGKTNCFPYICELSVSESVSSTFQFERGSCITLQKAKGYLRDVTVNTVFAEPNYFSCVRACLNYNGCLAVQYDTTDGVCSLYSSGGLSIGCGLSTMKLCYLSPGISIDPV